MKKIIYTSLFATMILSSVNLATESNIAYAQEEITSEITNESNDNPVESTGNPEITVGSTSQHVRSIESQTLEADPSPESITTEEFIMEESVVNEVNNVEVEEIAINDKSSDKPERVHFNVEENAVDDNKNLSENSIMNISEHDSQHQEEIEENQHNIEKVNETSNNKIVQNNIDEASEDSDMDTDEAFNSELIESIQLVDDKASRETQELFMYLKEKMDSKDILFGQQHATDEGVTLSDTSSRVGSEDSEIKNSVGDYPAVFGWDTLSIDGFERPGEEGDIETSIKNTVTSMKKAHDLGGIIVLSMHPHNFVTGGSFNDISGDVVNNILPGGEYHTQFNNWLDNIAGVATQLKDDDGNSIPIIFRPFHEQNGGWFWWGASTTNPNQYTALFRYTVEYLRDTKGVDNILYAYSPNSSIQGDKESYLKTYPGDNYVDILGIDSYDNKENAGSETFLNGLTKDLEMIVSLAQEKNKIAALTEFGYSPQGIKETGNTLDWYTKLFNQIQKNENASKIAYMLTWANFGLPNNMFVPYRDVNGDLGGDHELLPDFEKFYNDENSIFRNEVGKIYQTDKEIELIPNTNSRYVIRPSERHIITSDKEIISVKGVDEDSKISYQFDDAEEVFLSLTENYFSGELILPKNADNLATNLTIRYYNNLDDLMSTESKKVYIKLSENENEDNPLIVDKFDDYFGDDELLNQSYANNGDPVSVRLVKNDSEDGYGMEMFYTLADNGYSGRQLSFNKDWTGANAISFYLETQEVLPHDLTVQIRIGDVSFESHIKLDKTIDEKIVIPFSDFKPAHWESNQNAIIDFDRINNVTQFAFYFGGPTGEGKIYIDSIESIYDETFPSVPERESNDNSYQPIDFDFDVEDEKWIKDAEIIDNGTLTLSTQLEEGAKREISYQSGVDLTQHNWYVAKLKTTSPTNVKLFIKVGDSWEWFESENVLVDDMYSIVSFDLSSIENRANIKEIGIELTGTSNTKQPLDVTVDYVRFVKSMDEISNNSEVEEPDRENEEVNEEEPEYGKETDNKQENKVLKTNNIKHELKSAVLPETGENNKKNIFLLGVVSFISGLLILSRKKLS